MKKKWKKIPRYGGRYAASDHGDILDTINGRTLSQRTGHGYRLVTLNTDDGEKKVESVHRLVCEAFHGAPASNELEVDHINRNRSDNRPSNLEWVTHRENIRRAFARGIIGTGVDGTVVSFPSLSVAEDHGFDKSCIRKAIKRGDGATSQGFTWEYATP